ncbi:hypothetical protein FKM82_028371 [Ascaphus truei]
MQGPAATWIASKQPRPNVRFRRTPGSRDPYNVTHAELLCVCSPHLGDGVWGRRGNVGFSEPLSACPWISRSDPFMSELQNTASLGYFNPLSALEGVRMQSQPKADPWPRKPAHHGRSVPVAHGKGRCEAQEEKQREESVEVEGQVSVQKSSRGADVRYGRGGIRTGVSGPPHTDFGRHFTSDVTVFFGEGVGLKWLVSQRVRDRKLQPCWNDMDSVELRVAWYRVTTALQQGDPLIRHPSS